MVSQPTTTSPIMRRRWARWVTLGEVDVEQVAEGVAVGDLEHAVGADQDVHVERVDVGAENALLRGRASRICVQQRGGRLRRGSRSESSLPMNSPRWMFSIDTSRMKAWWSMWWSKVSSASRRDRVDRIDVVDLQSLLGLADAAVGVLQHGQVELLFAAEVVVDHPLRGAGALGDLVDAGAGVALTRRTPRWRPRAARRACARRRAAAPGAARRSRPAAYWRRAVM